jgi:hypothetical protein
VIWSQLLFRWNVMAMHLNLWQVVRHACRRKRKKRPTRRIVHFDHVMPSARRAAQLQSSTVVLHGRPRCHAIDPSLVSPSQPSPLLSSRTNPYKTRGSPKTRRPNAVYVRHSENPVAPRRTYHATTLSAESWLEHISVRKGLSLRMEPIGPSFVRSIVFLLS